MKNHRDKAIVLVVFAVLSALFLKDVIFSNKLLFGTDWLSGTYMQRSFFEQSLKSDKQFPLWNPSQFAGIPAGEGFFGEIFHPLTLPLKFIFPAHTVWTLIFFIHMILAGFGMYLYLSKKVSSKVTAFVFSLVFMFTSSMLSEIYGGHDGRFMVISCFPLLLYCIDRGIEKLSLKWFLFSSIPASLMLLTGHIQSSYYAIVFSLFYVSFNHINNDYRHKFRNYTFAAAFLAGFLLSFAHRYAGFALFLLSVVLIPIFLDKKASDRTLKIYSYSVLFVIFAAGLSAVQYLPVFRFLPYAARGMERSYEYAVSWSMGFPDIFDQIVSGFAGINFNQTNTYWGENAFKLHSTYIGVIPFILAVAMLFTRKKNAMSLFFSVSFVAVFILALGSNTFFYRGFYSLFPYVDKFRAPELIFFIAVFSTIVLAAMIYDEKDSAPLLYASAGAAIFGVAVLLFPQLITDIFRFEAGHKYDALRRAVSASSASAFKTIIFSAAAYFSFALFKGKMKKYVLPGLCILMFFDLWTNNSKFVIPVDSPDKYFAEDNIVKVLKQDEEKYRLFSFGYRNDDYLILHGFEIISGNHPSPFAEYQKFINNGESVMFNPEKLFMIPNRLKFLNVKYAIVPLIPDDTSGYDERTKNAIAYYRSIYSSMGFNLKEKVGNYAVMTVKNYLPRAFCIDSFITVKSFDSALAAIDSDSSCGLDYAITDEDIKINKSVSPLQSEVSIVKYSPNKIEIKVNSNKECLLVLLDQHYKPWKCTVNSSPEKIYKTFGMFRGVKVHKGENTVLFWFDPTLQIVSAIISLLTLALIVIFGFMKKD
ncbi:MAG: hypothetical protein PHW02_00575 [bacterium]|nr:hypothetical protein [bacterium]